MADLNLTDIERRMHAAHDNYAKELSGLRTGRASAGLLDGVMVEVYGAKMPLNQCASVSVAVALVLQGADDLVDILRYLRLRFLLCRCIELG